MHGISEYGLILTNAVNRHVSFTVGLRIGVRLGYEKYSCAKNGSIIIMCACHTKQASMKTRPLGEKFII